VNTTVKRPLLLSCLILLALVMVGPRLENRNQPASARIVVRAGDTLAPVNSLLFGQNFGPWMNTTESYVARYRDAGVTLLRFPAGNYGDENDVFPNNLDDLAALANALDAQVVVQARLWRKGTPEKAAEAVRYCNVVHDYGFRYWEVGNEPDLYERRVSRSGDPDFTIEWYNACFRELATAMKAVDPDIQVVGPAVTGGWREWMPAFIAANGDIVDAISWHWYPHGNELSDAEVLTTPAHIQEQVETIRAWWRDPAVNPKGHQRAVPPLFLSEYNVSWATSVHRHLGTQVGALWNAEVVGRMANVGVEMAAHFALQGTTWQGLIGMLEDARPVYGVYQLYARWGRTQVAAESSDELLLPAFASLRDDGKLAIIVINKDPALAREATLAIEGFWPAGEAEVWLQDEEHLAAELPAIAVAETFPYTFPPYSVTAFLLEAAPWSNWPLWAGLGLLVVALAVLAVLGHRMWRPR